MHAGSALRKSTRTCVRKSRQRLQRAALQDRDYIAGMVAPDDSPDLPWCVNRIQHLSRKRIEQQHQKARGYFRAISPPFFHGGCLP